MIQPKEIELKDRIMRRVYLAYTLRKALSANAIRLYVVAIVAAELSPLSPFISLNHVIANMPRVTDIKAMWVFNYAAFMHTHVFIQVSLIALFFVMATYAVSVYRYIFGRLNNGGAVFTN